MTLITIDAVVNVISHFPVMRVRLVLGVAARTSEDGVVGRIGMARRAHTICPAMPHREPRVIKRCSLPRIGVVTRLACGWEIGCRVIGIGRGLVIASVA